MANRPDIIIVMTDEERAVPPYESAEVLAWRQRSLTGRRWFDEHGISFTRHYTGSLACVPSRPNPVCVTWPPTAWAATPIAPIHWTTSGSSTT